MTRAGAFIFVLAFMIAASASMPSISAFQLGSANRVMWENDCDLFGQDIYAVLAGPESCGNLCADASSCTHWAWSSYNGGTCWLKGGTEGIKEAKAGTGCGYVIGRFTVINSSESGEAPGETSSGTPGAADTTPTVTPTPTPSPTPEQSSQSTTFNNGLSKYETAEMLDQINAYRAENGLSAVTIDNRIMAAAMAHSTDQARRCTLTHTGSDGSKAWDRMFAQGYNYASAAENVAAGHRTASAVMAAWWRSDGHRANILNSKMQHVGFALAKNQNCSKYQTYWTQDFGSPRG